ncbi:hypothetical protein LTS10_002214 [Elasticomyces elasticus]|nr:hypothetical protein LTS10_002214 [Elasticomyces elasticus]
MAIDDDKTQIEEHERNVHVDERGNSVNGLDEKATYIPANDDEYVVTWKTWFVVSILALSYGISFWIVPSAAAAQTVIATQLGDATKASFYIAVYTMTVTIGTSPMG